MWSVVIDIMKMNYDAEKLKGVEMKKIIDVCCGGRMFWFDKQNPNVEFCDNRKFKTTLCDGREFEVNPDTVCDFTQLPFKNNSLQILRTETH